MGQEFSDVDSAHMRRALALARRGRGKVEPNPMVGCVLARGARRIGEGYHRAYGGPHAEVNALRNAAESVRGATAYVTLEPCPYYGKTPPCTEGLIEAGVGRVVAAMLDPAHRVNGRGVRRLRRWGVAVDVGLLRDEAEALNRPYLTLLRRRRPFVILKWAQSLDGKIATRTGDARWISDERSRRAVHRLRARMDAILVGIGTVLRDDPLLTARGVPVRRVAVRVVLDTRLRVPQRCHLVTTAGEAPTLVFTSRQTLRQRHRKAARLERCGVMIESCPTRPGGLDLRAVLRKLGRRGMTNLMVEGGGRVLSAFLNAGIAEEAYVFVAPKLIGGFRATGAYMGRGIARIRDARTVRRVVTRGSGNDKLYHLVFE